MSRTLPGDPVPDVQDNIPEGATVDQADDAQGDKVTDTVAALWDQIPDYTDQPIALQKRDEILVQVYEGMPARSQAQERVALLNAKGIPVSLTPSQYGREWTRKKFTNTLGHAKKRWGME